MLNTPSFACLLVKFERNSSHMNNILQFSSIMLSNYSEFQYTKETHGTKWTANSKLNADLISHKRWKNWMNEQLSTNSSMAEQQELLLPTGPVISVSLLRKLGKLMCFNECFKESNDSTSCIWWMNSCPALNGRRNGFSLSQKPHWKARHISSCGRNITFVTRSSL